MDDVRSEASDGSGTATPAGSATAAGKAWPPPPPPVSPARQRGFPPPPPPPRVAQLAPPAPHASVLRRPSRFRRVKISVVVIALVVAGVRVIATGQSASTWAKVWDPRVEPLARFVEQHRGLSFVHPVGVDFIPDSTFVRDEQSQAKGRGDSAPDDAGDAFWKAFGLVDSSFDAGATGSDAATGIVGVYEPSTHRIRVRGEALTVDVKVTLVHELTHALQDQHFHLDTLPDLASDNAENARRAVIEGDATDVEDQYLEQLSDDDRTAYDKSVGDLLNVPEQDRIPDIVNDGIALLYASGPRFVHAVATLDGQTRRDSLFTKPPTSELEILYPDKFLAGFSSRGVLVPPLKSGETVIRRSKGQPSDVGAVTWLAILAQHIDGAQAVAAVEGWAGDAYVAFNRNGVECARASIAGATADDTSRLGLAFQHWATERAGGTGISVTPEAVVIESCAGAAVTKVPAENDPIGLVTMRSDILVADSLDHASRADRTCVADKAVAAITGGVMKVLGGDDGDKASAAADTVMTSAAAACGLRR